MQTRSVEIRTQPRASHTLASAHTAPGPRSTAAVDRYDRSGASVHARGPVCAMPVSTSPSRSANNGPITSGQLRDLVHSAGFQSASVADRAKMLDIFDAASASGRSDLQKLAQSGRSATTGLNARDSRGGRLLDSLHKIATGPIASGFASKGVSRESLLSSTLREVADPGQINQSSKGTCTATSASYMLAKTKPAEYARLVQGLASPSGNVAMAGGAPLRRVADSLAPDTATARSPSERILQAALMDYGNGREVYSNRTDRSVDPLTQRAHGGLNRTQEEHMLEGLFGKPFSLRTGAIIPQLTARNGQPTYVDMRWGENGSSGHAVVVERVAGGRVYFRNPWGATGDPNGTQYQNPPRRLEDRTQRLESMSTAEFQRWVKNALVPG